MDTIPKQVREAVDEVMCRFRTSEAYYMGGCLQDRPAEDYDVAVYTMATPTIIEGMMNELFPGRTIHYPVYEDECNNPYKHICTLKWYGCKVDFLFCKPDLDIYEIMDRFPLSIQMQALYALYIGVPELNMTQAAGFYKDPIIVYDGGTAEEKYRRYFPDTKFVNPNGTERRPWNDPPF